MLYIHSTKNIIIFVDEYFHKCIFKLQNKDKKVLNFENPLMNTPSCLDSFIFNVYDV